MVCGLSIGLSLRDMREMRTTDVANIVGESGAMRPDPDAVRDATQEDIDKLKRS